MAIQENFGKKDKSSVSAVKNVYKELGMEERYRQYEEETYRRLTRAAETQDLLPKEVLLMPLKKMYRRYK